MKLLWTLKSLAPCVVFFIFFSISNIPSGSALIKCFNCSSWEDSECLLVKVNDTRSRFVHPCDDDDIPAGAEPFCRTITQTIRDGNGTKRLRRKCGWIKHSYRNKTPPCYSVSDGHHEETVCQCFHDLCNNALAVTFNTKQLAVGFITALCVQRLYKNFL